MNDVKVINIKDYEFSDGGGEGQAGGDLDDFLEDQVDSSHNNKKEVVQFFSDNDSVDGGERLGEEGSEVEDEEGKEEKDTFWGGNEDEDEEDYEDEEDEQEGGDDIMSQGGKSTSTVDELSQDPMFLVLSHFLTSKTGENIADILQGIKQNLTKISFHQKKNIS